MNSLLKELRDWQIKPIYDYGKIILTDGDKTAREHYQQILDENDELHIQLILDLVKCDRDIRNYVEERAAIRWANGLPGDFESAVRCNF